MNKVKDPSKGSYYIEYLTSEFLKDFDIKIKNEEKVSNSTFVSAEQIDIKEIYSKT